MMNKDLSSKLKSKGKEQTFDFIESIHAAEVSCHSEEHPAHRFEVRACLFTLF